MLNGKKGPGDDYVTEKFLNHEYYNYSFRSTLAQFIATLANSMMFLGVGMMVAIPTIIIGVLHNAEGDLSLNDEQSSWVGGLMMLIQPIGCVIAGFLQNFIGRKSGMILMNIPELVSWGLLYTATSVNMICVSVFMMGVSAGFMEAPGLAYIGEITEPRIRGLLTSFANINVSVGLLIEFLLGSVVEWRTAIAISAVFPILSIIMIAFIPDSPIWLLGKGRKDEALQALRWLRGWTSEERVKAEFDNLCLYAEASKYPVSKISKNNVYTEVQTKGYICANGTGTAKPKQSRTDAIRIKITDFFRPSILRPFGLIVFYQFFFHCAALSGVRGYMIEVFSALEMPVHPRWLAFLSSAFMIAGGISCILMVRFVGKRKLSLISMLLCAVFCIMLGAYSYYKNDIQMPWIPLVLFSSLYFSTMIGIGPIPWMLISEVFPVRGRATGTGMSAAFFYVIAFFFSKTYLNLRNALGMSGCFFVYGVGGLVGFIFLYFCLPETEGKTLAEIETHFSKKRRRRKRNVNHVVA